MSLQSVIKSIKKSGYGFVKVELEASLGRGDSYDDREDCDDCYGDGRVDCDNCSGEGTIENEIISEAGRLTGEIEHLECDDCCGEGRQECYNCDGSGTIYAENGGYGDENHCEEFILDHVSPQAREALNYGSFYDDGSVDSEFTFTLPVEKAEYIVEFINAFTALSEEIGNGMEVDGAGMHVAVLPIESGGRYPVRGVSYDHDKLMNFQTEVTKLLPALFIAACSGNFTRELYYRHPKIDEDKYSAINIVGGGVFEYRLFETCYQRPEAIFEYLGTIARTLEYYADTSKKVASIGKEFSFYDMASVDGFTSTPEQVSIIKKQLKFVTPKDMTIKELTVKRDIKLSVQESRKNYRKKYSKAKAMYKEHIKAYHTAMNKELTVAQQEHYKEMQGYGYFADDWSEEQKKARVLGISVPEMNEEKFISNNITGNRAAATVRV